ncbi:MAG TPA: hypothetical protein VFX59_28105 [Polyangiales bacterium]|nr:hypothetical protein [Polyangiales bacterium]
MRALRWMVACAVVLGCAPREEDFCQSNVVSTDAGITGDCITFEEASELATEPNSGVHTLTVKRDPANTAAAIPTASNSDAICRGDTCYVRAAGKVAIFAAASPGQRFLSWSCSESTSTNLELTNLRADTECIARFVPQYIVVTAGVSGWYDQHVQLTSSNGCSATDSCVTTYGGSMTLVAPASESHTFLGWAGCSESKERTITLSNLTQPTMCVAQYELEGYLVRWTVAYGGSVRVLASSSPDTVCTYDRCTVVPHGSLILEAEPLEGWQFVAWSCGDVTTSLIRFDDITAPISCEARFVPAE